MRPIDKFTVFYIFLVYNEGDLNYSEVPEKDILHFFENVIGESKTLYFLDLNIADGYFIREMIVDDPENSGYVYRLTKRGVQKISELYSLEIQDEFPELNQFHSLHFAFIASNLPELEKEAYDNSISEVVTCFMNNCLNAAISISGKLLEIYLTELLTRNNVEIKWFHKGPKDIEGSFTEDLSLNQLFILAKTRLPNDVKLASIDETQIELIKRYRNGAAHHNKSSLKPSKEVTLGIMQFVAHFLRHRLTW